MIESRRLARVQEGRNRKRIMDKIRKERIYGQMKNDAFNQAECVALL